MRFLFASNDFRGFAHVLSSAGHELGFWDRTIPAFDLFAINRFDALFIDGSEVDRALAKCLAKSKAIPVIWDFNGTSDFAKGLGVTTFSRQKKDGCTNIGFAADIFMYRRGITKPEFECDVGFFGDCKPPVTNPIESLCHSKNRLTVKIFGTGWDLPQCLGRLQEVEVSDLYASAGSCPHVEDGNGDRPFNVRVARGDDSVLGDTYFERTIDLLVAANLEKLVPRVRIAKGDALTRMGK